MKWSALAALCAAASVCACDAPEPVVDFDALLRDGEALYSQGKEELIVRHFFRDRHDGFFLDVGCYKWQELSTTYYLESALGWSGIALDEHREGYERNRPRTRFRNFVVGDVDGGEATFFVSVSGKGVSSTSSNWIRRFYQAVAPDVKAQIKKIRVPQTTLDSLLAREGVEVIDFLSMDIEGSEPQALLGFDIDRFRPQLVAIEMADSSRRLIRNYFEAHDYEVLSGYVEYDKINRYFRPRSRRNPEAAANPGTH